MTGLPGRGAVVFFHAHPDDEALLTGGSMARAAAEGRRVVLVVATAGERGLTAPPVGGDGARARARLAATRLRELERSAQLLGAARVEVLGYADSGSAPGDPEPPEPPVPPVPPAAVPFAEVPVEEAATRLATLLREEDAAVLTVYDRHGGYGHPDHVQVHRVGHRAAQLAGTPVVLEATLDRTWFLRAVRLLRWAGRVLPVPQLPAGDGVYTARQDLTHRVDVAAYVEVKRAALRAHASQGVGGARTLALLLRLPRPLARRALGTEWYRQR